jgi:hypothetical protein
VSGSIRIGIQKATGSDSFESNRAQKACEVCEKQSISRWGAARAQAGNSSVGTLSWMALGLGLERSITALVLEQVDGSWPRL